MEVQEKEEIANKIKICGFGRNILRRNARMSFLRKLGKNLLFSQLPFGLHAENLCLLMPRKGQRSQS